MNFNICWSSEYKKDWTVKFWFVQKKIFRLKTICSSIFPKFLVVLTRECAWEEGEVVLTNFTIHLTYAWFLTIENFVFEIGRLLIMYIYKCVSWAHIFLSYKCFRGEVNFWFFKILHKRKENYTVLGQAFSLLKNCYEYCVVQ